MARSGSTTLSSSIARAIERDIIESGWNEGHFLGNEEDLGHTYGVGRATLREAIRLLGHSSLVEMRRGPGGGLYVRSPPTGAVVEAMVVYFELSDLTLQEIYEARQTIENLALALCIEHADDDAVDQLAAGVAKPDGSPFEFARQVATLSSNAALSLFVEALTRLNAARLADRGGTMRLEVVDEHRASVVRAIAARDAPAAIAAAERALAIENDIAVQSATDGTHPFVLERNGDTALADQVASAIRRQIVTNGWPEGHVLGSEPALCERFGVSRGTFREAVRILEHHNVAAMRRGPGGGLVVRRPDPGRAIDSTCRYLEHIKFDASDLRLIRDAVEQSTAALAARRITPVGAARLGQALERERLIDSSEINTVSHTIHAVLAELSGNRFLEFCTAVLTRLTGANVDRDRVNEDLEQVRAEVNLIHSRIVDAVIHGDSQRASKLMGAHLKAVVEFIDLNRAGTPV